MLPQAEASSTKGKLLGVCAKKVRSENPFMGHFMPYFVEGKMELLV